MLKADPSLVNRPDPRLRWPPLFWAVDSRRLEVAKFLIKSGAKVSFRASDKAIFVDNVFTGPAPMRPKVRLGEGTTVLHLAAEHGDVALTELLLQSRADLHALDEFHHTPLELAELNEHQDVIELLKKSAAQDDDASKE